MSQFFALGGQSIGASASASVLPMSIQDFTIDWFDLLVIQGTHEVKSLSPVRLFASPWTVAHQTPQSMEFSRQGSWSGLPFPSPASG